MNIRPWRIFYLYLIIGAILLLLASLVSKNGLIIFGNENIRWISFQSILPTNKIIQKKNSEDKTIKDSLQKSQLKESKLILKIKPDSIIEVDTLIKRNYFIFKSRDINAFSKFFTSLKTIRLRENPIHILHFGDSQLDGDRITHYLRGNYQKKYGGSGCGFVNGLDPVKQLSSVYIDSRGEWQLSWLYDEKRSLSPDSFGLLGSKVVNLEGDNPAIVFKRWSAKLSNSENYTKAKLFITATKPNQVVRCFADKALYQTDSLKTINTLNVLEYQFPYALHQLEFQLDSSNASIVHGCLLDGEKGVQVDNLALRGQLFTRFEERDSTLVTLMAKEADIQLIILQFGDNLLPTSATEDFSFYTQQIKNQVSLIRRFMANVPIIIIGVGDSAERVNGVLQTRASVAPIMEAQKLAAIQSNALYFDLFTAMGGSGSIIKWADEEPKRAVTDYTHFNQQGGKEVANLIFTAIENEYQFWLNQQNLER